MLVGWAGCIDDAQPALANPDPIASVIPYGTVERVEGNVSVEQEGSRWIARQQVMFTNGVGNATQIEALLLSHNGGLKVVGWSNGSVRLVVDVWIEGTSQQGARNNMEQMQVGYADEMNRDRLRLAANVERRNTLMDLLGLTSTQQDAGASMTLFIPGWLEADLSLETSNGEVSVTSVNGPQLAASTTNGPIAVLGNWDSLDLRTRNGPVVARTEASASGSYALWTTNGPVELSVDDGADHGFDVVADTSNGPISLHLRDAEEVTDQHDRHVRTRGFDDKPIKTTVELTTSNGAITVTGRG